MARSLRKLFTNLRGSFYQAQVQARQAGAFLDNPLTFSWRVVRGFFTNWLNSDEENRKIQGEEKSNTEVDRKQQEEATIILTTSKKTYIISKRLVFKKDSLEVFLGSQDTVTKEKFKRNQAQPILVQNINEDTYLEHKKNRKATTNKTPKTQDSRLMFESAIVKSKSNSENPQPRGFYYIYALSENLFSFKFDVQDDFKDNSPFLVDRCQKDIKVLTYGAICDIFQSLEFWEKEKKEKTYGYRPLDESSFLIDKNSKIHVIFWRYLNQEKPTTSSHYIASVKSVLGIIESLYLKQGSGEILYKKQEFHEEYLKSIKQGKISFQEAQDQLNEFMKTYKLNPNEPVFQPQDPETQSPEGRDNRLTQFVNWFKRSLRSNPQDSRGNTTETETSSNTSRRRSKSRRRPWQVLLFWFLFGLTLILFVIPFIPTAWQRIANLGVTRVLSTQSTPPPTFQTCFPTSTNSSPDPCLMRNQASSPPSPVTITYGDMVEHIFGDEDFKTQFQERTGKSDWSWVNTASPEAPEMDNLDDAVLEITVVSPNSSDNLQGDGRVIGYDGLGIFGGRSTSRILDEQISKAELVEVLKDINNTRFQRNGSSLGLNLPRNRPDWETTLRTLICSDADCPLTEQAEPGEAQNLRDYLDQIRPDATVGVAPLSFVKSQCQIYSIAIEGEQPLVNFHGQALTSETELCDQKGGYWPDLDRITTLEYPLSYAIVVRPSPGQEQLAEELVNLLRTDEGQSLLRGFGLTPCRFPNGDETQERCQLQ